MRMRPDVNVVFTETPVKSDVFSIRLQVFEAYNCLFLIYSVGIPLL